MPTIEISTLLFQAGSLGVFVWFVLVWSDRMAKSQQARDDAMQKFWNEQRANDRIVLSELCNQLDRHDKKVDAAVEKIIEHTEIKKQALRRKPAGD